MAKQTKITIETDSLLILRGQNLQRTWCPLCGAEAEMIALNNAGVISNLDRPALEEWLNSGELHRSKTPRHVAVATIVIIVGEGERLDI